MPEAEAKRFGGGSSFGKSFASPKKVKPAPAPQQKQAPQSANKTANTPPKKSGMGGMLGGLLAGGLLAALFFGGAFEGMQMMDFLLIGLLAFLAFKIFGFLRQQNQSAPSYAGGPQQAPEPVSARVEPVKEQTHHFTPMSAAATQLAEPELVLPQWFNKVTFLNGAKEHFTTLQAAWDQQDWAEISTYTTEELLDQLKAERANHPADQVTEVVSVMSELINFIDDKDHVVASIHFYGWIKEEVSSQATEFSEIWHLSRDMTTENAHWYIVGIEQP